MDRFFQTDQNKNAAFWEMFLVHWNTGAMDRNLQKFFRYARNALGLDYYYEHFDQATNDLQIGEKVRAVVEAQAFQIMDSNATYLQAAIVTDGVPVLLVELTWHTDVVTVTLTGDRPKALAFKAALEDMLPDTGIHSNRS